jgi:hypothetical protein
MKKVKHCTDTKLTDIIPILAIVFGSFLSIIMVVLIFPAYTEKNRKKHELALAQLKKLDNQKEAKEKEIINEIVTISGQYCGSLIPQT